MDAKLTSSVGARGRNNLLDVIKVQVMLKLLHRGEGGTGPYYKQKIDGIVGGATTAAIQLFAKHHLGRLSEAEQKKYQKKNTAIFEPGSALTKELQSYNFDSFFSSVEVLPGTTILYKHLGTSVSKSSGLNDGYLIPSSLSIPLERKLDKLPFKYTYQEVRLGWNPDKFYVKLAFPNVEFADPRSLKLSKTIPKAFTDLVARAVRKAPWERASNVSNNTAIQIATKKPTGLYSAYLQLDQNGKIGRVISSTKMEVLIPEKKEVLRIAGVIQAEVCAATGVDGGAPFIGKDAEKLSAEILKKHPSAIDKRIPAVCRSCKELGDEIQRIRDENNTLIYQIPKELDDYDTFVMQETIVRQFEGEVAEKYRDLLKIVIDALPFPVDEDSLIDEGKIRLDDTDTVEAAGELAQKSSNQALRITGKQLAKAANVVNKLKLLVSVVGFLGGMIELAVTDGAQYVEDLKRVQKRFEQYRLNVQNVFAQLEGNDVQEKSLLRDFIARGCGWDFIGNQFLKD